MSTSRWLVLRIAAAVASLAALLALGLTVSLMLRDQQEPEEPGRRDRRGMPGFHEDAEGAGITFRMNFLAAEQGENFKGNLYDHGCGVAIADFDSDGHDDLYFTNQLGPNALYRNNGDGTFTDVTDKAGVAVGDRVCVAAVFADTRNNGRQDLYVTSTRGGNLFFRNRGDGTFQDATREAGLTHIGHSQGALFFDYDNDGYLDLLVTNSARWTHDYDSRQRYYPGKLGEDFWHSPKEWNILYHNNGDGTFTDVTKKSGLKGRGWSGDAVILDYDEDGRPDVLITSMFGPSQLYHNNGDGTFSDVTKQVLGRTPFGGTGARAFDFNNDGRLDLFLVDMHSDMWMDLDRRHESQQLALVGQRNKYKHVFGPWADRSPKSPEETDRMVADLFKFRLDEVVFGNTFFKNLGGGKFEEMSDKANLETFWPWGIATGDFDNDGFEDVFLPSGMGYPFYYWPNQLLMNTGRGTFHERAEDLGIEPPERGLYLEKRIGDQRACRSSRCAAVADFDGDGRLEIVTNNFNDRPYYFRNELPKQNYLTVRLSGARKEGEPPGTPGSNRDAIGAVVKLYVGKEILTRQVCPVGGYLAQSSKTVHFGLGDRTKVDHVEIHWPGWPPARPQRIHNPALNKLHQLEEPRR